MTETKLTGVWAPTLTALHSDLSIDAERTTAHVTRLLRQGCHGVVLFGTTGEATSFSAGERMAMLERLMAAGVDPARVMVGTGCCALTDTVELTRHALALGCSRVLMLPPFYYKNPSDTALVRSYTEIIDRVEDSGLRVFFYHFPRLSMVPITPPVIEALLRQFPGVIAGIKDSSGDWDSTRTLIAAFPGLAVFPGTEKLLLPALTAGGAGTISATANVNAQGIREVYDLWQRDPAAAAAAQQEITRYRETIEQYPMVPALKSIVAVHDSDDDWRYVRPPLMMLDETMAEGLTDAIRSEPLAQPATAAHAGR